MRRWGGWLLAPLLAGCTVGPDFHPPREVAPAHWGSEPADVGSSTYGGPVEAAWWKSFRDPELSSLEARLAVQNLDLQAALQRVIQEQAVTQVTASQGLPSIDAQTQVTRERESPNGTVSLVTPAPGAPLDFNVFQNGLQSSWELDLFGKVRRASEAARANSAAAIEARHEIALQAIADLAQDYMQLRGEQTQLAIGRQNLALAQKNLALVQVQFADGVATNMDVANAGTQIAAIAASLVPMQIEIDHLINAIGLLLALPPRSLTAELAPPAALPLVPPEVPVGLPSSLLLRRPDVREAMDKLHAATAQTGVAVASFYPDITLGAGAGLQGLDIGNAFSLPDLEYSLGPSIELPLFEGGKLTGTLKLRQAQQRQAALAFRKTVLQAWQDVDDAMTGYALAQQERLQLATEVAKSQAALAAARQNYAQGTVGFLNVTAAQADVLNSQEQLAQLDTQIDLNLVTLYKALGGGWAVADAQPGAAAVLPGGGGG